jgi:hypothetical protein
MRREEPRGDKRELCGVHCTTELFARQTPVQREPDR